MRFAVLLSLAVVIASTLALVAAPAGSAPDARPSDSDRAAAGHATPFANAVVDSLDNALETETEPFVRLALAKAIIRIAPEHHAAAEALVSALVSDDESQPANAYTIIEEVIPAAPPALVSALLRVLEREDPTDRQRAAVLLGRLDPDRLGR